MRLPRRKQSQNRLELLNSSGLITSVNIKYWRQKRFGQSSLILFGLTRLISHPSNAANDGILYPINDGQKVKKNSNIYDDFQLRLLLYEDTEAVL